MTVSDRALERAGNAIAGVLMDCCSVDECENVLAPIHPDDWKRAARRALEEADVERRQEERRANTQREQESRLCRCSPGVTAWECPIHGF